MAERLMIANIKRVVTILLLAITFGGIFVAFGFDFFLDYFKKYQKEFPLSEVNGIVVDQKQNIYVGLYAHGAIQVYSKNGDFIENWAVNSHTGLFYLGINKKGNILVYTERGNYQYEYDKHGKLISETKLKIISDSIRDSQNFYVDSYSNEFRIRHWVYPKILKNGRTIIKQGFLLKMLTFPQSLILSLISLFILIVINRDYLRKHLR